MMNPSIDSPPTHAEIRRLASVKMEPEFVALMERWVGGEQSAEFYRGFVSAMVAAANMADGETVKAATLASVACYVADLMERKELV